MANIKPISTENLNGKQTYQLLKQSLAVSKVDPTGMHEFTEDERVLIETWIQYKNLDLVSQVTHLDMPSLLNKINSYYISNEIKRIEETYNQMRLCKGIMSLDDMQSYLSSMIVDFDMPYAERIAPKDKLNAIKTLMQVKMAKEQSFKPDVIDVLPTEEDLDNLSVESIKLLLNQEVDNDTLQNKDKIINEIMQLTDVKLYSNNYDLLKGKSIKELDDMLKIIKTAKKEKQNEEKQVKLF